MQRLLRRAAWAMLVAGLIGTALYVGLLTSRRVNPPAVPVSSGDRIPGHQVGEAGLIRAPDGAVALNDVLAVRGHGKVRLGVVRSFGARDGAPTYVLGGTGASRLEVSDAEVVGKVDRWVPAAGWVLLLLRQRLAQLVLGAAVVGLLVMLVTGLGLPLEAHATWPPPGDGEPLALGPGGQRRDSAPVLPEGTTLIAGRTGIEPAPQPGPAVVAYRTAAMSITPDDLRKVRFAQTRRGYDTEAVDRALDTVAEALDQLLTERHRLIEQTRVLEAEVARYKGMETSLTETLALAEHTAEGIRAEAQAEALRIVGEAQALAPAAVPAVPDGAMVEMLGELRGIRGLLQTLLGQAQQQLRPGS